MGVNQNWLEIDLELAARNSKQFNMLQFERETCSNIV